MKLEAILHLFNCSLKVSWGMIRPLYTVHMTINTYTSVFTTGHPRIIKPPEDLQVVAGVTVTYDCFALAKPLHSLTWYFISANGSNSTIGSVNGTQKMIRHSGKYEITDYGSSQEEYGRLIVRDAQFENRGTYLCIVENRHGPNTASATLSVQGKWMQSVLV